MNESAHFCRVTMKADSDKSTTLYIANSIECVNDLLCNLADINFLTKLPIGENVKVETQMFMFDSNTGGYASEDEIDYIEEHFNEMYLKGEIHSVENEKHEFIVHNGMILDDISFLFSVVELNTPNGAAEYYFAGIPDKYSIKDTDSFRELTMLPCGGTEISVSIRSYSIGQGKSLCPDKDALNYIKKYWDGLERAYGFDCIHSDNFICSYEPEEEYYDMSNMLQAKRYATLQELMEGKRLDSSYRAAFYLLSGDAVICRNIYSFVGPEGIDFTRLLEFIQEYDEPQQQLISIAYNLFSWTGETAVTPFDISRMGFPFTELVCNAIYIASGEYDVRIEANALNWPTLVLNKGRLELTRRQHSFYDHMTREQAERLVEDNFLER